MQKDLCKALVLLPKLRRRASVDQQQPDLPHGREPLHMEKEVNIQGKAPPAGGETETASHSKQGTETLKTPFLFPVFQLVKRYNCNV